MTLRRRARSFVLATVGLSILAGSTPPVLGHEPSPGFKRWTDAQLANGDSLFKWAESVDGWLKGPMKSALETNWADDSTNNSDGIRFKYESAASSEDGMVKHTDTSDCDEIVPGWLGCANTHTGRNWDIWIRRTPSNGDRLWCQDPANDDQDDCWNVYRIGIHEAVHAGGFLEDLPQSQWMSETNSVIRYPPVGPDTSQYIARCDEARLQLWYDLADKSGHYANCFKHMLGAGDDGLKTRVTGGPAGTSCAPYGSSIYNEGAAIVKEDDDNYGKLSSNPLVSRTIYFDRAPAGTGNWTTDYASTTATTKDPQGNNWYKSFVVGGTNGSVSYDFKAHFKGETALDEDYSPVFTLTWGTVC